MGIDYRIGGLIMGSKRSVYYAYTDESSTQDAPALRTRDGGLRMFYDRSTLPTHPVSQTLMHTIIYTLLVTVLARKILKKGGILLMQKVPFLHAIMTVHELCYI